MRKPLLLLAFMFMQAMFLQTAQDSFAQDRVSAAQRLPEDSLFYFSIPDVEVMEEKWAQTSMAEMIRDPAFAGMREDLVKLVEKYSKQFEDETKLGLSNVLSIPSGEFCIAFVKSSEGKFGGLASLEYGESGETLEKILEKTADAMDKEGARRSIRSISGTKIVIFSFEAEDAADEPVKVPLAKQFSYFLKDKTIVVSNDDKILEAVLANWDGQDQRSLAAKKEYQYIQSKCTDPGAPAVAKWYLNPIGALQSILGVASRVNPQIGMVQGFLPALGITNLKAVGEPVSWRPKNSMRSQRHSPMSRCQPRVLSICSNAPPWRNSPLSGFQIKSHPTTPSTGVSSELMIRLKLCSMASRGVLVQCLP
ncbi:hypothetical protein [Gimesia maris]|uniref:hypothetical protein n=1 Tax=Gimesia maris TaxID=122 RepID=UPI0012D3B786|nr:hypothetical protein [Gimesia maris]QGQ29763.1 hypothetical protein F1729_14460 [Gimesia maris]